MTLSPAIRRFSFWLLTGAAAIALLVAAYVAALVPGTPSVERLREVRSAKASVVLAIDGSPIATFSQKQREPVTLKQISPHIVPALLSTEDHRFYEHHGVDLRRTLSAAFNTLQGDTQGGSTITQQLARNLFPEEVGRERSINRKVREIITAFKIERAYTKDEILETYLNTVPFLYNVVGIEMAARTYYDKPATDLNVLESATLAGMLKGTSYYNPVINPDRARQRRNLVLGQMAKYGELRDSNLETLRAKPLNIHFTRQPDLITGIAPHFAAYARKWLVEWADKRDLNLYTDGLVIQSTIDLKLQEAANDAVERQTKLLQQIADVEWGQPSPRLISSSAEAYAGMSGKVQPFGHFWTERPQLLDAFIRETPEYREAIAAGHKPAEALQELRSDKKLVAYLRKAKTQLQAGFVAIDPHSGEVRAWVGSRDFGDDQYDHVITAERQPGSTFKPFVYGAALERGISPSRMYYDNPITMRAADGAVWRPTDMDGSTGAQMSLREGLIHSKNTITVQVMQEVGVPAIANFARAAGVTQSKLDEVPSLALGTSPVTLMEMVSAYATIAEKGEYRKPVFIRAISDRNGSVLEDFSSATPSGSRVMSENTAVELIDMMRGVVNRGTGTAVKTRFGIVADIAGKTGTTQNNTDGWFILMHPDLVAGAWVGFNDQRVTMRSSYWGQGGHNAIRIVGDFFRDTMKSKRVNAAAQFPLTQRAILAASMRKLEDQWANDPEELPAQEVPQATAATPADITIRGDANGVVIESAREGSSLSHDRRPARDAKELEKILSGMGRDPETGAAAGAIVPASVSGPPPARPVAVQAEIPR